MKRIIDLYLRDWRQQKRPKPLLLRGARQVGKTYAVRELGKQYEVFIELNLEFKSEFQRIFLPDLDPVRIIRDIELLTGIRVIREKTLIFIDEAQIVPESIQALRYFYELMPWVHIIAAGSLIDFALEYIGLAVGRVQTLYMYPMSFIEFLYAMNEHMLVEEIVNHQFPEPIRELVHNKILRLLSEYLAIGGMPEVVQEWQLTKDTHVCFEIQQTLVNSYRQDFSKYAKQAQIKYVDVLFDNIPLQLGKKFKYSIVDGDFRKRELAPCLELLTTAGVAHKIFHTDAHGLPLGAQKDPQTYKVLFLDIALAQGLLGLDLVDWFLYPEQQFINKGEIIEAFVGQELLAYSNYWKNEQLFYWHREQRASQAEIDYITQINQHIIPIEVKSGTGSTLRSMHIFLESHAKSPYGIRFSIQNYSEYEKIHSYPLYAICSAIYAKMLNL